MTNQQEIPAEGGALLLWVGGTKGGPFGEKISFLGPVSLGHYAAQAHLTLVGCDDWKHGYNPPARYPRKEIFSPKDQQFKNPRTQILVREKENYIDSSRY